MLKNIKAAIDVRIYNTFNISYAYLIYKSHIPLH
jgi:hypothetical protein